MKKLFFLAMILMAVISCSRDNNESTTPEPPVPIKKLKTVNKDGNLYLKIYYDSSGRTTGNDMFKNGVLETRVLISYDSRNNPTIWNYYNAVGLRIYFYIFNFNIYNHIDQRTTYSYNANTSSYDSSGFITYTNNDSKNLNNLIKAEYFDSKWNPQSYYIVNYTDNLGSSTTDFYNKIGTKTSVSTWVKDDKIAWDKVLDPFTYQHEHNNISISTKDLVSGVSNGYTAAFTYDQYGYPLTAKYSYSNGTFINYTFNWE